MLDLTDLQRYFSELQRYFPQAPEITFDEEKARTFEGLWEAALAGGRGGLIEYRCGYPKHEFLAYLVERKGLMLHGSNFPDIKVLIPVRLTEDTTSYGNHEAVYACADGIWPIFFAVVNRNLEKTSWISSCRRAAGGKKFYFFSIHEGVPESRRWTRGTVYVLPREGFRRLTDEAARPVEEWASPGPVAALARLRVGVDDFPFRASVRSHGDEWLALDRPPGDADRQAYGAYVGRYAPRPGLVIEVARAGDSLFLNFPGYPPGVMWPVSEALFLLPPLNVRVRFEVDPPGRATCLKLELGGRELVAQRLD